MGAPGSGLDRPFLKLPVSALTKAEWNYKEDDQLTKDKLKEAISRNGQIVNIIVREIDGGRYEVVNGNHRLDAFLELGIKDCIAVNLGRISKEDAIRVALETNELEFRVSDARLAKALKELCDAQDMSDILKTLPYDEATINQYLSFTKFDFDDYNKKADDGDAESGDASAKEEKLTLSVSLNHEQLELWTRWLEVAKANDAKSEAAALEYALNIALSEAGAEGADEEFDGDAV